MPPARGVRVCLMNTVWDKLNTSIRESFAAISLADIVADGDKDLPPLGSGGDLFRNETRLSRSANAAAHPVGECSQKASHN